MTDNDIIELHFDEDSPEKELPTQEEAKPEEKPIERRKKRSKSRHSKRRQTKRVQATEELKPEKESVLVFPDKDIESAAGDGNKAPCPTEGVNIIRVEEPQSTVHVDFSRYSALDRAKIRKSFIQKVLILLMIQLSVSVIMVACATIESTGVKDFMIRHEGLYILAIWLSIAIILILICRRDVVRKVPKNYVIYGVFTLSMSYVLGAIASMTGGDVVMVASIMTCATVGSIALYAYKTKNDLTKQGPVIASLPTILIIMIVLGIIYPTQFVYVFSGAVFAVAFAFYLAYDIQTLLGRFELKYAIDDYVLAAIDIYIDIYTIFTQLMRFLSNFF
jgi:Integral membrane protein, interacts with FtsH